MSTQTAEPTIEEMVRELRKAGWQPLRGCRALWVTPKGSVFLGPYGAWKAMKQGAR